MLYAGTSQGQGFTARQLGVRSGIHAAGEPARVRGGRVGRNAQLLRSQLPDDGDVRAVERLAGSQAVRTPRVGRGQPRIVADTGRSQPCTGVRSGARPFRRLNTTMATYPRKF